MDQVQQMVTQYGQPVWDAAVRQVQVDFYINIVWVVLAFVGGIPAAIFAKRGDMEENFYPIMLWFGVVAATIIIFVCVTDCINIHLNPEWKAISKIIKASRVD